MHSSPKITQLLVAWSDGDRAALEALTPLVQQELHALAVRCMAAERPGHILRATALVNEAYIRLVNWKDVRWQNRAHFFALAAQIMRRVLVDIARAQGRAKRGRRQLQYPCRKPGTCLRSRTLMSWRWTMRSRVWRRSTHERAGWSRCGSSVA